MPDRRHPTPPSPAPGPTPDPFPDREPLIRRTWLCQLSRPRDREALERFEYLLYELASEASVHWGGHQRVRERLEAVLLDLGSLAVFLVEDVAELPRQEDPLQPRARGWALQLAGVARAMEAALQGPEPGPGQESPGDPERTLGEPAALVEDAVALLTLASRVAARVPPVEAALRTGDRELFAWASVAQAIRHDLLGAHLRGTEAEPAPDSALGNVAAMRGWTEERWDQLFRSELADLEEER